MVDAWVTCGNCGHRYGAFIPACPKCNSPNSTRGRLGRVNKSKVKKIAIVSGAVIGGFFILLFAIGLWMISQPNPYVNQQDGFSVGYPKGWIVRENYQSNPYFVVASFTSHDAHEQIYLRTKSMGQQSFDEVIDSTKSANTYFNKPDNSAFYNSDSYVTIGDKNVRLLNYQLKTDHEFKGQQAIFSKGNTVYFLTYQTFTDNFDQYLPQFHESVASFSFLDGSSIDNNQPSKQQSPSNNMPTATGTGGSPASTAVDSTSVAQASSAIQSPSEIFLAFLPRDDDNYAAGFTPYYYQDGERKSVAVDGTAALKIVDSKGDILYDRVFRVAQNEYDTSKTTVRFIYIPHSDVRPGLGNATATIKFTTTEGKILTGTFSNLVLIPPAKPSSLTNFVVVRDAERYTAWFILTDENNREISANGNASLSIVSNSGRVLYLTSFAVSADDFKTSDHKEYLWTFPISEVKNAIGTGDAKLTFKTSDGKTLTTAISNVQLPTLYTEEQRNQAAEEDYLASAVSVNQKVAEGNFEVTLVRVGHYTYLPPGTYSEVTNYRADFIITNIGSGYTYLPYSYLIVDDGSNQYDKEYGGTLEFKEVHSGVTVNGYQLYRDVSDQASLIKVIVREGSYPSATAWEFTVPLK